MKNFKYYNGENENPYTTKDYGKSFWWKVESYAAERGDRKEADKLSKTMKEYLCEHHWEGDSTPDTTREFALQRATEMYRMGIWSRNYVTTKAYTLELAILDSIG